jgi:DNA-binding winged helix-turn-helix (wHTH) protein
MDATPDRMPGAVLEDGFLIGELRVDLRAGEVNGPRGREQLDPKVMGVLIKLAESAGKVVTREALMATLSPDVIVPDDALADCLHELRRRMSAAAGSDHYHALIETIPKRGYRLNATITPIIGPPAGPAARRKPWVVWSVAALAALALAWFAWRLLSPA